MADNQQLYWSITTANYSITKRRIQFTNDIIPGYAVSTGSSAVSAAVIADAVTKRNAASCCRFMISRPSARRRRQRSAADLRIDSSQSTTTDNRTPCKLMLYTTTTESPCYENSLRAHLTELDWTGTPRCSSVIV